MSTLDEAAQARASAADALKALVCSPVLTRETIDNLVYTVIEEIENSVLARLKSKGREP